MAHLNHIETGGKGDRAQPLKELKPFTSDWDLNPCAGTHGEGNGNPLYYSHAFQETDSLRRTMQIVECSLLHRRAQGRVSS